MPAHPQALRAAGPEFLTRAFRTSGALGPDNSVEAILGFDEVSGGSTGRKIALRVRYRVALATLHEELFAKFSRDFDNPGRDLTRVQMASEVSLANVSMAAAFPVRVPRCYFADYHAGSGTGILITERVPFGRDGIDPLLPKSVDHLYEDAPAHYRAVLGALGRLAGAHRAGKLPDTVERWFPFAPERLAVNVSRPPSGAELEAKVDDYAAFARQFPGLLPPPLREAAFIASLRGGAPRIAQSGAAIFAELARDPRHIALCHWNAQLDNAWFWREADGGLHCGLMDWGNAGQLNVAMAIWGCLCGAHPDRWRQIEELVGVFVDAFNGEGAPPIEVPVVMAHLDLYIAHMGVRYMLDSPGFIRSRLPAGHVPADHLDAAIQADERIRSQLAILVNFLGRWRERDPVALLAGLSCREC
jgi:hypothetical protein